MSMVVLWQHTLIYYVLQIFETNLNGGKHDGLMPLRVMEDRRESEVSGELCFSQRERGTQT